MSSHPRTQKPATRISRADIEAKLREIGGEVDDQLASTKQLAITVGVVAVAVVVAGIYLMGRRRGKRLTTIVEIRRV